MCESLRLYANSGVDDGNAHVVTVASQLDVDGSAVQCELDGVEQKIVQHLSHAIAVDRYHERLARCACRNANLFLVGKRAHPLDFTGHELLDVGVSALYLKRAGDEPRAIEKIFDHLALHQRVTLDRRQGASRLDITQATVLENTYPIQNRRERC